MDYGHTNGDDIWCTKIKRTHITKQIVETERQTSGQMIIIYRISNYIFRVCSY